MKKIMGFVKRSFTKTNNERFLEDDFAREQAIFEIEQNQMRAMTNLGNFMHY